MDIEIKKLVTKLSNLKSRVELVEDLLSGPECPPDCEVKTQAIKFKNISSTYEQLWEEFFALDISIDDDSSVEFKRNISEFELLSKKVNGDIIYLLDEATKTETKAQVHSSDPHGCQMKPKIPPLTVNPFDGTPTQWLSFKESCEVVFHNNPNIEDIHKFAYLKKVLRGDALAKIEGIHLTAAGYQKAWIELCSYYDGTRTVIEHHIDALLNMQPIMKGTYEEVNSILNTCIVNVSSLEAHGYVVEKLSEFMIVFAVSKKFNVSLKKEWEKSLEESELPNYRSLKDFLVKQCRVLKSAELNKPNVKSEQQKTQYNSRSNQRQSTSRSYNTVVSDNSRKPKPNNPSVARLCSICGAPFHPFIFCQKFIDMPVPDRYAKVKSLNLCTNCFGSGHYKQSCQKIGCKKCHTKHHTLLHEDKPQESVPSTSSVDVSNTTANHSTFCVHNEIRKSVLLSTAIVFIKDKNNKFHECRALIDQGSQSNFMSVEFSNRYQFDKFSINNIQVRGLNENKSQISEGLQSEIRSCTTDYRQPLQFLVVSSIAETLPQQPIDISNWHIPRNIRLADPYFNTPRAIDILLGAEVFYDILMANKIHSRPTQPVFQQTLFGWLVGGKYEPNNSVVNQSSFFTDVSSKESDLNVLDKSIRKFWELESIPNQNLMSKLEQECEDHFQKTHSRDPSGRYVVKLPLKETLHELGESKSQALNRFQKLEYRFTKNPQLKIDYSEFIKDYLDRGHMRLLTQSESCKMTRSYYMPHHAILKPSSSTTKLRVVFDASAKTTSNISLNDVMLVGPTVQPNLFITVLRFRKYLYAITSDISKMYRQVNVHPSDTSLQRILWRSSLTEPINTYELTTVTYGTASAPYLATRVLNQLAEDEKETFPSASAVVKSDFYVDDVLTGANSIEEAKRLQTDLIKLLSLGGFKLHKWASNSEELINNVPPEDREVLRSDETSNQEYIGTLGLFWKPRDDEFIFNIKYPEPSKIVTKRSALSDAAKLFDPLGFAAPTTLIAKLFIQQLWKLKSDWDDPIPYEMSQSWLNYLSQLPILNQVSFPRCVIPSDTVKHELHGFSDASMKAFGCCVYLKTVDKYNRISVNLLCSKSRVAPLKTVCLPRLELCGALLLSELVVEVQNALQIDFDSVTLWCDSEITLQWIKMEPYKLKMFVSNRVSKINELNANYQWKHIPTAQNPADLVSRGLKPLDLQSNSLWWHGPAILFNIKPIPNENNESTNFNPEELELKKETNSFTVRTSVSLNIDFNRFRTLNRIIRTFAFVFRWKSITINRLKSEERPSGPFTVNELKYAEMKLIVFLQKQEFKSDYDSLLHSKEVDPKSKIKCLNPFIETNTELLRVGGRLQNANIEHDVRHQIILPNHHHFTILIFKHYHYSNFHASTQLLVSLVRQKYWPVSAKSIAKSVIRNCIPCFKQKPILSNQIMGALPSERVDKVPKPFYFTGVDLCGPFFVKNKLPRTSSPYKVYVVCFVCFVTKALHLEVLSDLSAECFIACLKRVLSRRGEINTLWSDNATNFVGANNMLKKEFQLFRSKITNDQISDFCASKFINWKFIPPRAPNFGGLWESAVKSLKFHLKRVTNGTTFSFEELNTLIVQIEGILNSRPLTLESNDPADPMPLTPGHFITGGPLTAICEPSCLEIPSNRLSTWRKITKMTQSFWDRFASEYIHTLQERKKWKSNHPNVCVNDVVLVAEDNVPCANWVLGVIKGVIPGPDNKIRVVEIKTKHGIFKRAISKIAKLPIENDLVN